MYRSIWSSFWLFLTAFYTFDQLFRPKLSFNWTINGQNTKCWLSRPLSMLGRFWMHFWNLCICHHHGRAVYDGQILSFRRRPLIFKNSGIFLTYTVETSPVYLPWFWMSKMSKICRNFWHIFDYFGSFGFGFAKFSDIWNQGKYTGLVPTIKIPVRSKLGKVEIAEILAKCMVGSFNLGGFKLIKT